MYPSQRFVICCLEEARAILPSLELGYRLRFLILVLNSFPDILITIVSQSPALAFTVVRKTDHIRMFEPLMSASPVLDILQKYGKGCF